MTEPLFHRRQRSTNYVPFTATSLFVLLILSCCSGCCVWASKSSSSSSSSSSGTAAAPWQEGSSWTTDPNDRDASKYYEIPPSTFAPGGRLYSVEAALRAARGQYPGASPTKGTVVVALPFHEGIVVVSSLPQSPYIYDDDGEISKKENHTDPIDKEGNNSNENDNDNSLPASNRTTVHNNNNTSLLLWNKATPHPHHPTFVVLQQLDQHVWGITADGSIVDGQVLRQRLRLTAQQWRKQSRTITASNLARKLADAAQRQTQSLAEEGRLLASTVLLWESSSSNSSSKSSSSVSAARTSTHPDKNVGGDDADEDDSTQQQQQQETPPPPPINIWRVDPNGQFWKCRAAVVGWGVISPHIERDLLSRWIRACRRRQRASRNDNDELCSSNSDNDTDSDDKEQQQLSIKRLSLQEWEELRVQLDRDQALVVAAQTIQAVLLRPYYKHSDAAATGTEQGNYMPSIRMEGMVLDSRTGQVECVSQTHFVELLTALQ